MAKISTISYNDTIDSLNSLQKNKVKNPYYAFTDASKTIVTYYHINKPMSTLDESVKEAYDRLGDNSPIRFDKILRFPLYSLPKMQPEMDISEFGLQSRTIEGEGVLLPNTIVPTPNDFFVIDYISKKLLFRVTNVNANIIENDNLMYRIGFTLDNTHMHNYIDNQVVNVYETVGAGFGGVSIGGLIGGGDPPGVSSGNSISGPATGGMPVGGATSIGNGISSNGGSATGPSTAIGPGGVPMGVNNSGTLTPVGNDGNIANDYKVSFIESGKLHNVTDLKELMTKLLRIYIDLFWNDKLEAFILKHKGSYIYDEYLTEFILRTRLISVNEQRIHVMHQTNLRKTFIVDYDKTFLRFVEEPTDGILADYIIKAVPSMINDLGSTFTDRFYSYFRMNYLFDYIMYGSEFSTISALNPSLIYQIEKKELDPSLGYWNLIIKHLINESISVDDVFNYTRDVDYKHSIEFYYNLPILIFIIRKLCYTVLKH